MIHRARDRLLIAATLLALLGAPPAQPQRELGVERTALGEPQGKPLTGEELARLTEEIASVMRCPVCQGLSVADSPTVSAMAMVEEVRQFLSAGYTREQILDYFEQAYGEFIRLEPKPEGFNLTVWIAPIAAILLGLALVARRLRNRAPAKMQPTEDEDSDLKAYRERVRREVAP